MTEAVLEMAQSGVSVGVVAKRLGISQQRVMGIISGARRAEHTEAVVAEVEHLVGYRYDLADVLGYADDASLSRVLYRVGRPDLALAVVHHCRPGAAELRSAA